MFFKSLRFKIIRWYMIIISLFLILLGLFLYHNLSSRLNKDMENILLARAEGVVDSIETYWETEKIEAAKRGVVLDDIHRLDSKSFAAVIRSWISEKAKDPLFSSMVISIYGREGEEIFSSNSLANAFLLKKEFLQLIWAERNSYFKDYKIPLVPGRTAHFRVLTYPVIIDNQPAYIIQVAASLTSLRSALNQLKFILFLLIPVGIVLSGFISYFLTFVTLTPINKIIDTIHRVTAENLKTRINLPDTQDEIKKLADTFNLMLDRLENTFSSERRFIQDLSHELKTPLAILKGELEVSLMRLRTPREYEAVLNSSLEEINRLIKIVDDLLILAKFDANLMEIEKSWIDITAIAERAADEMTSLAEKKKINLARTISQVPLIYADKDKIKRLFLNLLDNAVKFTPEQGQITLSVSQEDNWVKVAVSDTGIGIAASEIPKIFDRFYRAKGLADKTGFGLGLSIVKSIVEAHQGKIAVNSAPGAGTSINIFLPISPP